MTPESQRIAIAEACGWKEVREREVEHPTGGLFYAPGWLRGSDYCKTIPDYLNDLNACFPILGSNYDISCRNGYITVTIYQPSEQFDGHAESPNACHAICEAFLKSKNLWK